jgi:transcriptional regulator with XRE-family HTH domain
LFLATATVIVDLALKNTYLPPMTPEQCRAARGWVSWSQEDLAQRANVALSTVRDFEKGTREPIGNNIEAMQSALERAGIIFESQALGPAGIRYEGRVKEHDTYIPVLEILDDAPNGFMRTADLIHALSEWFVLSPEDEEILAGRSDTRFSQIVRNVVSHRTSPTNLIGAGWAEYDKVKRGLRITREGRLHLVDEQAKMRTAPYSRV